MPIAPESGQAEAMRWTRREVDIAGSRGRQRETTESSSHAGDSMNEGHLASEVRGNVSSCSPYATDESLLGALVRFMRQLRDLQTISGVVVLCAD